MTPRTASLVAGILLFAAGALQAEFLTSTTAANDSASDFARRVPPKGVPSATALRDAEVTGWNLYRYDSLSDAASFLFASQTQASDHGEIVGSIVVPGEQWRVRFYSVDASGKPSPEGDVVFSRGNATSVVTKASVQPFSPTEELLARAQEYILATTQAPCEGVYKVLALPGPAGVTVYRLRESLESNHVPEGQHVRYSLTANADGSLTVADAYDFTRRCNMLTPQVSPDNKQEEIRLTYAQEPQPNELHIYLSLRYGVSFYMLTSKSNLYWSIAKGAVSLD